MTAVREGLPELPARMKSLPVDSRGYPVPWFVDWIDGKPDFRVMDARKLPVAVNHNLCWICGQRLGTYLAFLIGPMCAITRTISEPPSHRECAEFAAKACPFLAHPKARRRDAGLEEKIETGEIKDSAGVGLKRNPGVALVWITKRYRAFKVENGILFNLGEPRELVAFAEGRKATIDEIEHSVVTGLPLLIESALQDPRDPQGAIRELGKRIKASSQLLGIPEPEVLQTLVSDEFSRPARLPMTAVAAAAMVLALPGVRR